MQRGFRELAPALNSQLSDVVLELETAWLPRETRRPSPERRGKALALALDLHNRQEIRKSRLPVETFWGGTARLSGCERPTGPREAGVPKVETSRLNSDARR